MRPLVVLFLMAASVFAESGLVKVALEKYGEEGQRAAVFLLEGMPEADRSAVSAELLQDNLDYAFRARKQFPWAKAVPESLFLNDVLPYAVVDETRENWRPRYFELASKLVESATNATSAAQLLNQHFFDEIGVHYSRKRERANQSPSESEAQGKASCTGLSVILVDALRAVGVPARIVGTPLWMNKRGNHTWVEFWDGEWFFLGADEFNANGPNRGWFVTAASKADATIPEHAIYATSWKKTAGSFPMVWSRGNETVSAVNVTERYTHKNATIPDRMGIRLWGETRERLVTEAMLVDENGALLASFVTKGGRTDLNDMPEVAVVPHRRYRVVIGKMESKLYRAKVGVTTVDLRVKDFEPAAGLSQEAAELALATTYAAAVERERSKRELELESKTIEAAGATLLWRERVLGEAPEGGRSLWISMHGGGGTSAAVNNGQWANQIKLYTPKEGIYIAPRAPTDAWNMWHKEHIDPLFDRLIADYVSIGGVDPNKVYLMGYSAGGDGVWQLAPRMADRFAAAAMMAGHPNSSSLLGLRNLPFAIYMGALDSAYKRNQHAKTKTDKLTELHRLDPEGYTFRSQIYEGLGHWMKRKDAESVPWMAQFERTSWPKKLVWFQDNIVHDRFYWLKLPAGAARKDQTIRATVSGQMISLEGDVPKGLAVRLSDALVSLDEAVTIQVNGMVRFSGVVKRRVSVMQETLNERLDPALAATAQVVLYW